MNNCTISKIILEKVAQALWGISCTPNTEKLIRGYIDSLGCTIPDSCFDSEECINETVHKICTLLVKKLGIAFPEDPDAGYDVEFFVNEQDILSGLSPYTFSWSYEPSLLEAIGEEDQISIKFKARPGISFSDLVTSVTVTVIDIDGCRDSKTCFIAAKLLKCGNAYEPCINPGVLTVVGNNPRCSAPLNLVIG